MSEKVFVTGATGNIGQIVVKSLLAKGVPTTVFVRNKEKSQGLFGTHELLSHVEGDYENLANMEKAIPGHTRLFLVCADVPRTPTLKNKMATIAYDAGVRQIVDISSSYIEFPVRSTFIGEQCRLAEESIYKLALERGLNFVAVRPTQFMTNILWKDVATIKALGAVIDCQHPNEPVEWISEEDIADVSTLILTDPVEKHANKAYTMIGDCITNEERAKLFSEALGKPVKYIQQTPKEKVDASPGFMPTAMATDLATIHINQRSNRVVPALLGRPYQTLGEWIEKNKYRLQTVKEHP